MKQNIGRIAVEGKHIIKDFQIGSTTTKVLKDISLQVMQGNLCRLWGRPVPAKVRCSIFSAVWTHQPAAMSF